MLTSVHILRNHTFSVSIPKYAAWTTKMLRVFHYFLWAEYLYFDENPYELVYFNQNIDITQT